MFFWHRKTKPVTIYLHIGTHKTGTTSIQAFLDRNRAKLRTLGLDVYVPRWRQASHLELFEFSQRTERDSFKKLRTGKTISDRFRRSVTRNVQKQIRNCYSGKILFTSEDLSLLRYPDEFEKLKILFGSHAGETKVVLFLREIEEFKRSWRHIIARRGDLIFDGSKDSILYTGDDSWVFDREALVKAYLQAFGSDNLVVKSYDEAVKNDGNVLPEFLRTVGIDPAEFADFSPFYLNRSSRG